MGINVDDVIDDEGEIFGDGVNVAVRLEGIAKPGGVCISDDAYRQIRGKVDITCEDLGPQKLRNIAEPMRVWSVRFDRGAPGKAAVKSLPQSPPPLALPDKPSIAVLPFQNMSDDPEQEYFADGMVEDITSAVSRIRRLFVIARNSSFMFKGKTGDIKEVGERLGVRYVLEGSTRRVGNRVRISAQLIEAKSGSHIWADRYDGD
jgi:TolB-like protein